MTIVITAIIITLAVIGILSETRTTDNATKANTTDSNLHGFTIPSFDKWCTEHPENEATERPSLFFPVAELTNSLRHISIQSFEDWCSAHPEQEQPGIPMFAPVAELTNSLPTMGGTTFEQWCEQHPAVEYVHTTTSKVCALEVPVCKIVEVEPVAWVETDHNFDVLREVLTQYSEVPGVQEQITWDVWCVLSGAMPEAVAEAVMADMTVGEILTAAADKNADAFRKVKGVGPKRAALIVSCLYEFWTEHGLSF